MIDLLIVYLIDRWMDGLIGWLAGLFTHHFFHPFFN